MQFDGYVRILLLPLSQMRIREVSSLSFIKAWEAKYDEVVEASGGTIKYLDTWMVEKPFVDYMRVFGGQPPLHPRMFEICSP